MKRRVLIPLAAAVLAAGCATIPSGPNVMTYPGPGKSFDQFQADQASCRQYASAAIGGSDPAQNAANSAVGMERFAFATMVEQTSAALAQFV